MGRIMRVVKSKYSGLGFEGLLEATGKRNRGLLVFITKSFKPAKSVNVIVYFHGNYQNGTSNFSEFRKHFTTNEVAVALQDIDKPLALVIPELGAVPSTPDWVSESKANFDSVIQDALLMAAQHANDLSAGRPLADESKHHTSGEKILPLTLGTLILAAHSGGGWPMRRARELRSDFMKNVKEVWMLDSLYDEAPAWMNWAIANSNVIIRNTFTGNEKDRHAPFLNSTKIYEPARKGEVWLIGNPPPVHPPIKNLQPTIESPVNHHRVPGHFMPQWIRMSTNL